MNRRAALGLAQLSSSPAVEDALARTDLPDDVATKADWVWEPFAKGRPEPQRQRLVRIFGRCRTLLDDVTEDDVDAVQRELDPRLLLAVLFFQEDGRARYAGSLEIAVGQSDFITANLQSRRGTLQVTAFQEETFITINHGSRVERWHLDGPQTGLSPTLGATLAEMFGVNVHLAGALRPKLLRRLMGLPGEVDFTESTRSVRLTFTSPTSRDWSKAIDLARKRDEKSRERRRNPLRGLFTRDPAEQSP